MNELRQYVIEHVSVAKEPQENGVDMIFFNVKAINDPKADDLIKLVKESVKGDFLDLNMFDGKEHGYMEIGGWIGDQGLAMQLMALGKSLKLWELMTPAMLPLTMEMQEELAGMGMISIKSLTPTENDTVH